MTAPKKSTPEAAAPAPSTPEDAAPVVETAVVPRVDHVAAVSYRADGTPDQTAGYVTILPED